MFLFRAEPAPLPDEEIKKELASKTAEIEKKLRQADGEVRMDGGMDD